MLKKSKLLMIAPDTKKAKTDQALLEWLKV